MSADWEAPFVLLLRPTPLMPSYAPRRLFFVAVALLAFLPLARSAGGFLKYQFDMKIQSAAMANKQQVRKNKSFDGSFFCCLVSLAMMLACCYTLARLGDNLTLLFL